MGHRMLKNMKQKHPLAKNYETKLPTCNENHTLIKLYTCKKIFIAAPMT
jgi:hypothetical protein